MAADGRGCSLGGREKCPPAGAGGRQGRPRGDSRTESLAGDPGFTVRAAPYSGDRMPDLNFAGASKPLPGARWRAAEPPRRSRHNSDCPAQFYCVPPRNADLAPDLVALQVMDGRICIAVRGFSDGRRSGGRVLAKRQQTCAREGLHGNVVPDFWDGRRAAFLGFYLVSFCAFKAVRVFRTDGCCSLGEP
jgi:hypothetical protein